MIVKECHGVPIMKSGSNTFQIVSMHVEECWGVSGHHKGELVQSASKQMNKSVFQGVSVNSRCPMEEEC